MPGGALGLRGAGTPGRGPNRFWTMGNGARMKMMQEFRAFALRGNVVDLAVGVIIGASFGSVVKSMVDDLIMPLIGLLTGGVDFSDRYVVLRHGGGLVGNETVVQARSAGAVVLAYGQFLNNVLTFLIVAWVVFLLVKAMNRMQRKPAALPPTTRACPECLTVVPKEAKRCSACASPLQAPAASPPS